MGWKMIYLARRNPALAPEQFPQAWREHSALGAGCTNVRDKVLSVTQCSRVLDGAPLPGAATDYDGVNLLVLRDLQAATDIWNDAETLAIMRPEVVRDAPRSGTCLVGFLRRREGLSAADWRLRLLQTLPSAWMSSGPFAQARRVVLNAVHLPPPLGYEYDVICEWWFDSVDDARAAVGSQDPREHLPASLAAIADLPRSVFMFTRVTHSRP